MFEDDVRAAASPTTRIERVSNGFSRTARVGSKTSA